MKNTHEGSDAIYNKLVQNPIAGPSAPYKATRPEIYAAGNKHQVAVIRTDDRNAGILEGIKLLGGIGKLIEGVNGEIVIKPNCNTDDAFPRNSHHGTVRSIAEDLINAGFPAEKICVGDTSGRFRGFPTRNTIKEMGIQKVADELGIQAGYFEEEEEWVTVKPPTDTAWPNGIKIPKRIYDAERVILTPIMRPHQTPIFTIAMKVGVGLLDPVGREWLHWNKNADFMNRMVGMNLAYSSDLIVTDAMEFFTGRGPVHDDKVAPGLIIVGSNRLAADAVAVCIMKQHKSHRMEDVPVREHLTFTLGEEKNLGSSSIEDINLLSADLVGDSGFSSVVEQIKEELSYQL